MLHQPAGKMYIDFAGDRMSHADMETGEIVSGETFAAVLPCSGYTLITYRTPPRAVGAAIRFFGIDYISHHPMPFHCGRAVEKEE